MHFMLHTNGSEEWFQLLYFSKAGLTAGVGVGEEFRVTGRRLVSMGSWLT